MWLKGIRIWDTTKPSALDIRRYFRCMGCERISCRRADHIGTGAGTQCQVPGCNHDAIHEIPKPTAESNLSIWACQRHYALWMKDDLAKPLPSSSKEVAKEPIDIDAPLAEARPVAPTRRGGMSKRWAPKVKEEATASLTLTPNPEAPELVRLVPKAAPLKLTSNLQSLCDDAVAKRETEKAWMVKVKALPNKELLKLVIAGIGENGMIFDTKTQIAQIAPTTSPAAPGPESQSIEPSLLVCNPDKNIDGKNWTELGNPRGYPGMKEELGIPEVPTGDEPWNRSIAARIPNEWDRLGHFWFNPATRMWRIGVRDYHGHNHQLIATDIPDTYIGRRFREKYPAFTRKWWDILKHPAVQFLGGDYSATKTISKRVGHYARHATNLPPGTRTAHGTYSHQLPMGTFAWVDWRAAVNKLKTEYNFKEVDADLILSIMWNERHSDHAVRARKKERFQVFGYHSGPANLFESSAHWGARPNEDARNTFDEIVAYRIIQGWDEELMLDLRDVHIKMNHDMFTHIAGFFHATRIQSLPAIFKTDLQPMGRAGAMFAMYKHGDPRAQGQQRWRHEKFDCITIYNPEIMKELGDRHDGMYLDNQGTISAPFNTPLHLALDQIIAKPGGAEYVMFDTRYRDFPIVGTIGRKEASPQLTHAIFSADFGARNADEAGWTSNIFHCPRTDCGQVNPCGMLVCLSGECRRIFVLEDPATGLHFSPIVMDYIKTAQKEIIAMPSSVNTFSAAAVAAEIKYHGT